MSIVLGGVFYFKRALCSALVVGSLGLSSGCTDETVEIGEVDLVAKVDGTDIFIGIVANDTEVRAYSCNGKDGQTEPFAEWFVGDNDNGTFDIDGYYGLKLSGEFAEDGSAHGKLYLSDSATGYDFATTPATGDDGTYFSERERLDGWVVIGDDVRGAVLNRGTDSNGFVLEQKDGEEPQFSAASMTLLAPFEKVLVLNNEIDGEKPDPEDLIDLFVTKATILKFKFES